MNASISDFRQFVRAASAPDLDRAIARADLLNLVKRAHDELVAAKIRFNERQRALAEFDESGRAPQ